MKNYYGITGIRLYATQFLDVANEFLQQHDGNIIDVQITADDIVIVYKEETTA